MSETPRQARQEPQRADDLEILRGLFDLSVNAQVVHTIGPGTDMRVILCNAAAAALMGHTTIDVVEGAPLEAAWPEGLALLVRQGIGEVIATGYPFRHDETMIDAQGRETILEILHRSAPGSSHGSTTDGIARVLTDIRDVTRERRADSRVSDMQRQLRMTEAAAHVGHWRLDTSGNSVFWSEEVYRIHGLNPSSDTPKPNDFFAGFHPDDQALARSSVEVAIRTCRFLDFAARIVRPNGDVRAVRVRGGCHIEERAKERSLFGVIIDVTDLRRAEARFQDQAAVLRVTLDNMDQGLIMTDPGGRIPVCNKRALELLQLPAALMASEPRAEEVIAYQTRHGEFNRPARDGEDRIDRSLLGGEAGIVERTRPNGTILEIRTVPLPAGGVVCTYSDVTVHRTAARALYEAERRYRLLADNSSDLIVLGRFEGEPIYVSPAIEDMLGYCAEDAGERGLIDWIHPEDRPMVATAIDALSPRCPEGLVVFRMRRKDGRDIWAEAAIRRPSDALDDNIVIAIRDVTERREAADQLRAARDAAEAARESAEAANRAKSDFLAAMSHEIRTPLNAVIGFSNLMVESGRLEPDLKRYADLVVSSGDALLTVVNDILDFSKVEAGKITLADAPFSPADLFDNCLSIIRGMAASKSLAIDARIDAHLPRALVGDEARLRQVILNLLNNAVKFTRQGSVILVVAHETTERGDTALRVCVKDTGIGIAKDKQHRLFETFSQVDGSIARDFGGTGLGLAICHRLVGLMGGTIGVVSEAGEGAEFWFAVTLPVGILDAAPTATSEMSPPRRGHLLLVEDIEINQELARRVLEAAGHSVDVVSDGQAAVEAVRDRPPYDLVLMDVQMHGMDGLTATKLIRGLPGARGQVPIIAMTANVLPEQQGQFAAVGMSDSVGKPFKRADLYATIDRWLGHATAPAPATRFDAAELLDEAILDQLIQLLGQHVVSTLLETFGLNLETCLDLIAHHPDERVKIRRAIHDLVPAAGMMGMSALATVFAECLDEARTGRDGEAVHFATLQKARDIGAQTLATIRARMSGLSDVPPDAHSPSPLRSVASV